MKKLFLSMLCGALLAFTANYCQAQKQPLELVNLFIGTGEGGNMYPGAQAPFGMISISPESVFKDYDDAYARSGYKYAATEIKGFGLTHFSGVGCHAMQDLQFLPVSGQIEQSPVNHKGYYKSSFTHTGEKASPGFYSVKLEDYGINAKFTVTQRAGISEITYNSDKAAGFIFQPANSANGISAGQITINKSKRQLSGYITTGGFCWRDPKLQPYTVYFVMKFDAEFAAHGVWKGQAKNVGRDTVSGNDIAAYLNFNIKKGQMVRMKTALSFVSVANAIQNLQAEIPGGNFDATWQKTRALWQKYFNKITVKGGSANEIAMFYTGIYHNLLQPNVFNDVNGQYTGFDFKVHKIEKGRDKYVNFSLWDTYRTTAQLQAILAPQQASDMVQSLLLDAQQGGAFPNWSMNNQEYGVMNGYSTFPFIANVHAFGARNFDLKAVKDMMKKVSENYYGCQGRHGWGNLAEYKKYKYVPVDKNGYGTSMTLEYGIDDYSIAKICQAAGDTGASKYYLHRSQNAFSLFNPHSGFIQGRKTDGLFINNYSDTSQTGFNEGNAAQYFWSIPHSTVKLIDAAGGNIAVEKRLDNFISTIEVGWAPEKPHYWLANEPCFGAVYVYNYLQVPQKAQYNVRRIINDYFKNTPDGMPGDDDAGSMSALYVFSAMGLYPYLPGEGGFMVTGPLFSGITINLKNGKKISINAKGAATNAPYIQQMLLNGKPTNNLWLNWDVINKGSNISFIMAQKQSTWGSAKKDLPPSYNPENDQ